MGKNKRPNIPLQNMCMNKILHAFHRRQRWQNVRRVLPNKKQGSGKHIIDGGSSEPTTNASEPPEVHHDPKKNKPTKNEQEKETTETRSKKFRIRSLISEEMAKRRGRRRSSSPTRSPKKKTDSLKKIDNDQQRSKCESPSTTYKKKRKCDICAAMLSVSYLRQIALANENMVIEDEKQQPVEMLDACYSKTGLTKSFSFPLLAPSKTRSDFELQQLKNKLRDFNDIQTTKEKFILPMNQWQDVLFPKPMLTRPESFTGSTSRKDKKQSKTLKQKIGFVVKVDTKKEKRRILMDAVFHKIPYGRKDPKKVLKTTSATTTTSSSSFADKTNLKKTSSTSEAMSKYRKLLSQTSTRDEKLQHSSTDHKPKLFVAGDHSFDKRTHKRIRSLPNISPYDFMHTQEFPVMDINLNISSTMFDDQSSLDNFEIYSERRNVPKSIGMETKSIKKIDVDEHLEFGANILEKISYKNESEAVAIESGVELETSSNEEDEAIQENLRVSYDYHEKDNQQEQVVDGKVNSSNHVENQKEPCVTIEVENDKSFNEILGMFKKVSDEQIKVKSENESSGVVRKVGKNTQGVFKKQEVSQSSLDHQVNDKTFDSQLNENQEVNKNIMDLKEKDKSCFERMGVPQNQNTLEHNEQYRSVDEVQQVCQNKLDHHQEEDKTSCFETAPDLSSLMDIPNSQLEVHVKRPNNKQVDYDGFLHLYLESVNDKAEFQFVKQVLDKSGFLKNEVLGFGEYWYSSYQPMDPVLFEEVETNFLQTKLVQELDSMKDEEVVQKMINDHHLLLFDLVNEALMEIHNKTFTYCPHPLTYPSKVVPMPVGCRLLEQVWDIVNKYLSWKPELDDAVSRDLAKGNGWMNLQADAEFVGIQLEELIVDDLLDELVFDDLLM